MFSVLIQLGDAAKFITPVLISEVGWRVSWIIGGGFGVVIGLLIMVSVAEPPRDEETIVVEADENDISL